MLYFVCFLLGVLWSGLVVRHLVESRWRDNADDYRRIESGGRLYKVNYDE